MSDPAVITLFKARLSSIPTAYVETLNVRPSTLPNVFTTIERDHSSLTRITLGTPSQFRELGILQMVVHTRAGQGDAEAQMVAEQVRDLFHNYTVDHLQVHTVGSAVVTLSDDGNFFELRVPVEYQFDFFKP